MGRGEESTNVLFAGDLYIGAGVRTVRIISLRCFDY